MRGIRAHRRLELRVIVTGAHLLPPTRTIEEVREEFSITATVEMQRANFSGRLADAEALGRGVAGLARALTDAPADVVVVLGDRIEAFAAAAAASVSGIRVAHLHGGDRAEGIADEALRHAITKLAHVHLPATQRSALRIIAMGEDPQRVHIVGSPAIDGLDAIAPLSDREFAALGSPQIIVLLHPVGDDECIEYERAAGLIDLAQGIAPTLALHPNHDPGRDGIVRAIEELQSAPHADWGRSSASTATAVAGAPRAATCAHLPREKFIGLLRRAKVIVGNSSAGLIECAAIPTRAVNIGRRQSGREAPANVISIEGWDYQTIRAAIIHALEAPPLTRTQVVHPYGDGRTGQRVAELLATLDLADYPLIKRNAY